MLLLTLVAVLYFYNNNPAEVKYPTCPFLFLTGYYCPGCGSSRAFHHLIHGRIQKAFSYNPLMVLSIPFVIYILIAEIGFYFNNKPVIRGFAFTKKFYMLLLFIIMIYWILRNIPYYPFILLAP